MAAGELRFGDRDLLRLSDREMRRLRGKDISLVPQDPMSGLNPVLTIGEQVVETIQAHENVRRNQARRRAAELLGAVGIARPEDQLRRYPHQFSGGMRQRVMIAIALSSSRSLIADEPTTALDVTVQAQVLELLHELTTERGTAILLVSHDLGIMARMTWRIAVMYAGYVVESAPTARIFARPSHPYTAGLLRSVPRIADAGRPLTPIRVAARPRRPPHGCPFAPRCAWALDVCWQEMPPLEGPVTAADIAAGQAQPAGADAHLLACHNPVAPGEAEAGQAAAARVPACSTTRSVPAGRRGHGVSETLQPAGNEPSLLDVRDLRVHFPITRGTVFRRTVGQVHAVDGVSLGLTQATDTFGLVGESGSGKDDARTRARRPHQADIRDNPASRAAAGRGGRRRPGRGAPRCRWSFRIPMASLDPRWKAGASIAEPLAVNHVGSSAERGQRVRELLEVVGLSTRPTRRDIRMSCPAGSGSESGWRGPSHSTRRSSSLMKRSARSTCRSGHRSSTCFSSSRPNGGSPTSSSHTTSPWSATSAIA